MNSTGGYLYKTIGACLPGAQGGWQKGNVDMVAAEYDRMITSLPNAYLKWLHGKLYSQASVLASARAWASQRSLLASVEPSSGPKLATLTGLMPQNSRVVLRS